MFIFVKNTTMEKTAVEWLFKQVWITPVSELPKILEQAKQIEKQQIIDAYKEFLDTTLPNEVYEEQYNKTFNK
jgi:hypothetical protein